MFNKGISSVAILDKAIQKLIDRYLNDIENCNTPLEKIHTIVKFVLNCEQVHPFADANCRTFCMVLLNSLLIENHFPPVILDNVMRFHGFSSTQLTRDVIIGMRNTLNLVKRAKNVFYCTTDYLEQELDSAEKKAYFKEVCDAAQSLAMPIHFDIENYSIKNQKNKNNIVTICKRLKESGPQREITQEDIDSLSDLFSMSNDQPAFIQNPQLDGWQIDIILSFTKHIKNSQNYQQKLAFFVKQMSKLKLGFRDGQK